MSVTLYLLEPPYSRLLPAGSFRPSAGAVLVADLSGGIPTLARAVEEHRAALWCPLVAALTDRRIPAACLTAFEVVPGAFAPLYPGDYPTMPYPARALRAVARRPAPTATTIAVWVEHRLSLPGTASTLSACFGHGCDTIRPPRTLTRRVRALGPLEVRDWRGLARLARIVTTALAPDRVSLECAAFTAGVDPRSLRRWLRLATELSWPEVMARAGWEWILEMALRRFGYVELSPSRLVAGGELVLRG
ncbi:MAG TPA: hypothetical protein VG692_01070 [Gemmatimonadales bacterium]|nr:hypothetical protein [Gemmatimonadales bacterium]